MASAIPAIKSNLVTILQGLFPTAQVVYGVPSKFLSDVIVSVGGAHVDASLRTMSSNRPMDEVGSVMVYISVTKNGGEEMQQVATEAAFAMLTTFRDYFKTRPNETLSGATWRAWVSSYDLDEADDPEILGIGRNALITATLSFEARN